MTLRRSTLGAPKARNRQGERSHAGTDLTMPIRLWRACEGITLMPNTAPKIMPVKMANSRGTESLKDLGAKTRAIPVSLEQVVQDVDVLFLVVPQKAIPELPKGLLNKARKETIVIDVGNYYPFRDGRIDELENGLTESVWVERQIGRPVIKVLNTISTKALMAAGRPAGSKDRVALPISGDNTKAKEIVAQLIDRIGVDYVDGGTIAE